MSWIHDKICTQTKNHRGQRTPYHTHKILFTQKMEINQVSSRTVNIIILGQCMKKSMIVYYGLLVEVHTIFQLGINKYFWEANR